MKEKDCVSKRKYNKLRKDYEALDKVTREIHNERALLLSDVAELKDKIKQLEDDYYKLGRAFVQYMLKEKDK